MDAIQRSHLLPSPVYAATGWAATIMKAGRDPAIHSVNETTQAVPMAVGFTPEAGLCETQSTEWHQKAWQLVMKGDNNLSPVAPAIHRKPAHTSMRKGHHCDGEKAGVT